MKPRAIPIQSSPVSGPSNVVPFWGVLIFLAKRLGIESKRKKLHFIVQVMSPGLHVDP